MPRVLSENRKAVLTRARQAKAREKGLCQLCPPKRRHQARAGRSTCHECSEKQKKFQQRKRREKAKEGLCGRCFARPREHGCLCKVCFEKTNSYPSKGRNVTRAKRKKLNVCITGCGRSAYVRQKCDECVKIDNIKFRHRREERAAKGLCVRCGRHPAARGKKTCKSCLKSRRVKPHERKTVPMPEAQRTCGKCGAIGHRQSSKKCPQWKPNPNQHGFGRTTPVYRRTREVIRKAALILSERSL